MPAGGSLLDHPLIGGRYFYPFHEPIPDPFWVEVSGARLACARFIVDPDLPTLIHFHGNGEVVADYLQDGAQAFLGLGINLILAEYRGYGMSTGKPLLGSLLDDACRIVEASGIPPEKLILFGRSVGSLMAIHAAAAFPTVAGLILESGIAEPMERLLIRVSPRELGATKEEFEEAVDTHLNHKRKLAAYPGQVLILHAALDDLVSVRHARLLNEWAAGEKRLVIFDRGDHNTIWAANHDRYLAEIKTFLAGI